MRKEGELSTDSTTINDLFLSRIRDYRLDTIYSTSGSNVLNTSLEPWLMDSAVFFTPYCTESLDYVPTSGSTTGYFLADLSLEVQLILSQIMVKYWMQNTVQDILQMQNFVTDRDFKTFSSAQNLKSKQDYLIVKIEEIDKLISDYSFRKNNWTNWYNQNFAS
jgi:hypothetical protein